MRPRVETLLYFPRVKRVPLKSPGWETVVVIRLAFFLGVSPPVRSKYSLAGRRDGIEQSNPRVWSELLT